MEADFRRQDPSESIFGTARGIANRAHRFYALPIFRGSRLYSYALAAAFRLGDIAIGLRRLCHWEKILK
ncbi:MULTISPECIES: hypothetical protein [unclassified Mesorhizobium]|uniref:hypothetical protein n=1 Tax=unclassified Mesorhizobium TaxID=325217 RepID=UPI001128CD8A|nr:MULTISPECIES: hypothetical protein [unclassified Mesorhizobium]TPM94870.1 hypothetical protein FJ977_22625 [Mesorhizobium sp. B2-1-3A]